jgi:hypothetical protein
LLTVSLTVEATFAGVLVTVSTVSVTGEPPEVEPPPEDPPDEDEPPEVPPREPDDPEAFEELPLALFEPPELELDGVLEVEFEPVEEEDGEDSVAGAEDDSCPTASGAGASSTTGAARVTSSAVAAWPWPW